MVDGTGIEVPRASNPELRRTMASMYYKMYALLYQIGVTPSGCVVWCSEARSPKLTDTEQAVWWRRGPAFVHMLLIYSDKLSGALAFVHILFRQIDYAQPLSIPIGGDICPRPTTGAGRAAGIRVAGLAAGSRPWVLRYAHGVHPKGYLRHHAPISPSSKEGAEGSRARAAQLRLLPPREGLCWVWAVLPFDDGPRSHGLSLALL